MQGSQDRPGVVSMVTGAVNASVRKLVNSVMQATSTTSDIFSIIISAKKHTWKHFKHLIYCEILLYSICSPSGINIDFDQIYFILFRYYKIIILFLKLSVIYFIPVERPRFALYLNLSAFYKKLGLQQNNCHYWSSA